MEKEEMTVLELPGFDDLGSRSYSVEYFNQRMEEVKAFVHEHTLLATPIADGDTAHYKAAKKMRADLNSRAKAVAKFRKEVAEFYLGTFNSQCKQIEDVISQADALFKPVIDDYEQRNGIGRFKNAAEKDVQAALTVTITAPDDVTFNKLIAYAKRKNCRIS